MQAETGDGLTVQGRRQGDEARHGVIVEVHGESGAPPYLVRWEDGHESVFFPTSGTMVEHHPRASSKRLASRCEPPRRAARQPGKFRSVGGRESPAVPRPTSCSPGTVPPGAPGTVRLGAVWLAKSLSVVPAVVPAGASTSTARC